MSAKYKQVEDYIKKQISDSELRPGEQIPTEDQIADHFNFSRMTVNKALVNLSDQGYIKRIPGRGSFVSAPRIEKSVKTNTSFTEDMKQIGLKAGSKLIKYEVLKAGSVPDVMEKLKLSKNDYIHYFIRLRTGDDIPIGISYTYISANVIPAIDIAALTGSFYDFIDKLGIVRSMIDLEVKAVKSLDEYQDLLNIGDSVILSVSHVTFCNIDEIDVPFEYIVTHFNSDYYIYRESMKFD